MSTRIKQNIQMKIRPQMTWNQHKSKNEGKSKIKWQ